MRRGSLIRWPVDGPGPDDALALGLPPDLRADRKEGRRVGRGLVRAARPRAAGRSVTRRGGRAIKWETGGFLIANGYRPGRIGCRGRRS